MKVPYLVQRCTLDQKLHYEYMGSCEFEIGDQSKSLKRIFAAGIVTDESHVTLDGKKLPVHMVAGKGFNFNEYWKYLQQMAEDTLRLKEPTYFELAMKERLGLPTPFPARVNVWFDFENDVLWTLEDPKDLVGVLEKIKAKWAEK